MKNIGKYIGLLSIFLVILLGSFFMFSKFQKADIKDAIESLDNIETANIKATYVSSKNGEKLNYIYNFNINTKFTDDRYKEVVATDGNFGIEVESLQMGFYAPLKLILDRDLIFFLEIDESYEDILGIPGGEVIRGNLTSLRKNLGMDYEYSEMKEIYNKMMPIISNYLVENKKNFTFYPSEKQGLISGVRGRLTTTLTENMIVDLKELFVNNLDNEDLIQYKINSFFDNLKDNFLNASIYFDFYGGEVNVFYIQGKTGTLTIEISNINNPNTITLPTSGYTELVDYLSNNAVDFLELLGFEVETTLTKVEYLKRSFSTFASYMIASIDYSEEENFEYADVCIQNMKDVISEMDSKIFDEADTSVDVSTYSRYIDFFKELLNYCTLYKESFEDKSINFDKYLKESIENLTMISKELDIDISGVFDNVGGE